MSRQLVLIGAGEFAQIACEYFEHDSDYDVVAFSVEQEYLARQTLADRPVVPYETLEARYPPADFDVFVAIPSSQLNRLRTRFYLDMKRRGYRLATYVSTRAFVWRNAELGDNCFIFEGNVIQPFVRIGLLRHRRQQFYRCECHLQRSREGRARQCHRRRRAGHA